ncbi:putative reverse transcriptase domain-containing protein [Tanacetum coccineum]
MNIENDSKRDIANVVPFSFLPHIRRFSGTFYIGEGSSSIAFSVNHRKIFALGPLGKNVDALHYKVKSLAQQMKDRAKAERRDSEPCKMEHMVAELRHHMLHLLFQWFQYPNDSYVAARNAATVLAVDDDGSATPGDTQLSEPRGSPRNAQIMPPKAMSQAAIERLITQRVNAALDAERAKRENTRGHGSNANGARGQGGALVARECTFVGFMKCNLTVFHENEGAVELCRWFEKTEMVFGISECAKRKKVKFAVATLQGRALTWWNSQVATLVLEATTRTTWTEMKRLMTEEFCLTKEIQRIEHELWNLKVKDSNITAYTQRFNELVLLCP